MTAAQRCQTPVFVHLAARHEHEPLARYELPVRCITPALQRWNIAPQNCSRVPGRV
jgi:hypothetical protein